MLFVNTQFILQPSESKIKTEAHTTVVTHRRSTGEVELIAFLDPHAFNLDKKAGTF